MVYLALIRPLEALLSALGGPKDNLPNQAAMMEYLFISDGARWTAEQYGSAIEQAFTGEMGESIGIREYRQIQAALSGHHLSKWKELWEDTSDATFEQQGHSTETHDRDYDRIEGRSSTLKTHSQMRFEHASMTWQRLVFPGGEGLEKRFDDQLQIERKPVETVDAVAQEDRRPEPILRVSISALNALRRLLGNNKATFRSEEQAMATAMMLEQGDPQSTRFREDLLVVLPTGAGKTLTWMIAQALEGRDSLTIVNVPLRAILLDLAARLQAHGQPVHVCSGGGPGLGLEGRAGFVLTSVERAVEPEAVREIHDMEHRIVRDYQLSLNAVTD